MSKNANLTLAQKSAKLGELVEWFESEDFKLEEAIERYKEAEALATEIEEELGQFKNEINILKKKFDQA